MQSHDPRKAPTCSTSRDSKKQTWRLGTNRKSWTAWIHSRVFRSARSNVPVEIRAAETQVALHVGHACGGRPGEPGGTSSIGSPSRSHQFWGRNGAGCPLAAVASMLQIRRAILAVGHGCRSGSKRHRSPSPARSRNQVLALPCGHPGPPGTERSGTYS